MSSRSHVGKKKNQRNQNEVERNQIWPRVIQVRLNPPKPQIIEIRERTNEDKAETLPIWDILKESSLILTIITAILFMIGWAYESNWYAFFGVSPAQIDIPIPQVLLRSIPTLLIAFLIAFISLAFFYLLNMLCYMIDIIGSLTIDRVYAYNEKLSPDETEVVDDAQVEGESDKEIMADQEEVIALKRVLIRSKLFYHKWEVMIFLAFLFTFIFSLLNPYSVLNGLQTNGLSNEAFYLVPPVVGITVYFVIQILTPILISDKSLTTLSPAPEPKPLSSFMELEQGKMAVLSFLYLLVLLFLSSRIALSDAALGRRGLSEAGAVQKVYLVSPKTLMFTGDLEVARCETDCIYGPFGLIAENSNSFFLTNWKSNQMRPGIYVIPRSDQKGTFYIVPETISIPSPSPTLTSTSTLLPSPTSTSTPLPSPTPTPEATFSAQPTIIVTTTVTPP